LISSLLVNLILYNRFRDVTIFFCLRFRGAILASVRDDDQ